MSKLVEELRELAQAATPGPWRAGNAYGKSFLLKNQILVTTNEGPYVILEANHHFPKDAVANTAFVAAANPAAVLELLAHIERLNEEVASWQRVHRAEYEKREALDAHIERMEEMRHGFAEDYKKWWKANVEISFDQWINFESTHWTSAEDAAYQAWQHLHENVVYPMQKNIERLEAELARVKSVFEGAMERWRLDDEYHMKTIKTLTDQLAEAKNLFLTERTEGLTDQEQQEEWDDAEEYFDRMMALTAQQADKGE